MVIDKQIFKGIYKGIQVVCCLVTEADQHSRFAAYLAVGSRGKHMVASVFERKQLIGMITWPKCLCRRKPDAESRTFSMTPGYTPKHTKPRDGDGYE